MNDRWMEGAWDKLARADEHLEALYAALDGWGKPDTPFRITRQCDPSGRQHAFRVHFIREPDVAHWAGLFGDALHNLRSALDHVVYSLAVAETRLDPPPNDARLMFPICSSKTAFKKAQGRIEPLNTSMRAAVKRAQPYNRLKPGQWFMPLWWLAQLNDIDKHRVGHIVTAAAHHDGPPVIDPGVTIVRALWNEGFLDDKTPIFLLLIAEPKPNVYVDLKATASVVLRVGKIRPLGLAWVAWRIRREVEIVMRYLSMFFPAGHEPGPVGVPTLDPKRYGDTPPLPDGP